MQKIRFFFILFILPASMLAQQRTKIILKDSERGSSTKESEVTFIKKPVFSHDDAILSCDSALFYTAKNVFEAFNNVHIVQGDTINIYSDHLIYDGNTKIAHLTSNVRMIDKESVLTTNTLDYNMGTKVGTYIEGGKIVNKDVTLTSKNGYYFSNSRDAYFRYNVLVVSPKSTIRSDTLRYNTLTNWTYFYGPTNIKSKDDNLYTENGAYNTKTEYAYFGKKNLYTNGPKSLKGDSLYYDGIAGYGKAVRNIVFKDTSDKTVLHGQLGYYYKIDERAVVTKNAYVGMGTKDSIEINKKLVPDSLWMGADTLQTQMVFQKTLKLVSSPVLKKDNELGEEEKGEKETTPVRSGLPSKQKPTLQGPDKNNKRDATKKNRKSKKNKESIVTTKDSLSKDSLTGDTISIKRTDSLLKDSLKINNKDTLKKTDSLLKDSLKTNNKNALKKTDSLIKKTNSLLKDSLKINNKDTLKKTDTIKNIINKKTDSLTEKRGIDSATVKKAQLKDTVSTDPADTIKTRIIKAYNNVRVFKTNMQAVADSLFYTNADSTLRWYGKPILWSQGSQQTGDTIYLRLKDKKLNTLQVIENGFVVNVNSDSAKYNQVKGRLITAFFKNGELNNMFVDGNAESIYYMLDKDSVYTDMSQTVSSRIKILFKDKKITNLMTIKDVEGVKAPVTELKEDVFLTGFIWKPELRPLSKKEVINGKPKSKTKPAAKEKNPAKTGLAKDKENIKTSPGDTKITPDSIKNNLLDKIKQIPAINPDSIPEIKKADSTIRKILPAPLKKK